MEDFTGKVEKKIDKGTRQLLVEERKEGRGKENSCVIHGKVSVKDIKGGRDIRRAEGETIMKGRRWRETIWCEYCCRETGVRI